MKKVFVVAVTLVILTLPACSPGGDLGFPGTWLVVGDEGGALHAEPDPSMLPESLGFLTLKNRGDKPVELEEIVALDAEPGLEVLGFRLYRGRGHIAAWCGFPPRGLVTEPIRGATIAPDETVGVWVGLTTRSLNVPLNVSDYRVRYRVGRTFFVQRVEYTLGITAKPDPSSSCPSELPGPRSS